MRFEVSRFMLRCVTVALVIAALVFLVYGLSPASAENIPVVFQVEPGQGFREIIGNLKTEGLVRSSFATEVLSAVNGAALKMKPGLYKLSPAMSAPEILNVLASSASREVTVVVPEGSNIFQVDSILADALVIERGELINFEGTGRERGPLEGKLFPDTYRFFTGSSVRDVVRKFLDNFDAKAVPILAKDKANATKDIIIASMVEKEVANPDDQKIVAGIMWKRLGNGMPLDIDATICYAKLINAPTSSASCYPLSALDYKIDSGYNTYLYQGLPPAPIGNPGISALEAAISPKSSPYWYYLSDPATGKTIYATSLDEQNQNRVRYLHIN